MRLLRISPSTDASHKWMAVFEDPEKTTHFGARGYEDYTQHRNELRKANYLKRHAPRENWRDPTSAGALSRWILWNKPTLTASIADFKKRFSL